MRKFTTLITCGAFLFGSILHAEDRPPVQVGKAAEEGSRSGKNWGEYVIAGVAIAVAIVAIVLVAKQKGSSSHSHS